MITGLKLWADFDVDEGADTTGVKRCEDPVGVEGEMTGLKT
jgi:hypothetical protein